jgi:hypothetical protein
MPKVNKKLDELQMKKDLEEKINNLMKRFGIGLQNKTIVDKLISEPQKEKGVNMPTTDVKGSNFNHQIDLLMMPHDNNYKYILVVADLGSKYIGAEALTDKTPQKVKDALIKVYKDNKYLKLPKTLEMDDGGEFKGEFKKYFENQGVLMNYKKAGRHRQQATVEAMNGIIGLYLNKRMLSNEIAIKGEELIADWVEDLPKLIEVLNYITTEKLKLPKKETKRSKLSENGILPVCEGSSCEILPVGTEVRIILDEPRSIQGLKLHGTFRKGDLRWDKTPRKIEMLSLRPNQPPMYLITGINNVAYTKQQLQVIDKNEKQPPKEAIDKYIIENIINKKVKNKKVYYLIKWKDYDVKEATWELKENIPKNVIEEYEKKK